MTSKNTQKILEEAFRKSSEKHGDGLDVEIDNIHAENEKYALFTKPDLGVSDYVKNEEEKREKEKILKEEKAKYAIYTKPDLGANEAIEEVIRSREEELVVKEKEKKRENPFNDLVNAKIEEIKNRSHEDNGLLDKDKDILKRGDFDVEVFFEGLTGSEKQDMIYFLNQANGPILAAIIEWNNYHESRTERIGLSERGDEEIKEEEKDPLLEKLNNARSAFADIEFRNRQEWGPLKKFFALKSDKESPEVGQMRKAYEETLKEYIDSEVKKLEESGKKGAELSKDLAELYTMVNYKEFLNLYDARTESKMNYLAEKEGKGNGKIERGWNWIKSKSAKLAEGYNKLPWYVKLGMAGTVFATGATALISAKRMWGAFMMVSVGGMSLDKLMQQKDRGVNWYDKNKFALGMMEKEGSADFQKLKDALYGKVDDIDGRYRKYIKRSGINKVVAFTSGILFGASATCAAVDYFSDKTAIPNKQLLQKVFDSSESKLNTPVTDSFIKPQSIPSPFVEHVPTQDSMVADDNIKDFARQGEITKQIVDEPTVEVAGMHLEVTAGSGKGIENVLIETLKEKGVDNSGAVAHRMVLEYADKHGIPFDKLNHIKFADFDLAEGGADGYHIENLNFDGNEHDFHDVDNSSKIEISDEVSQDDDYQNQNNEKLIDDRGKDMNVIDSAEPEKVDNEYQGNDIEGRIENADYYFPETGNMEFMKFAREMKITNGDFRTIATASAKEITNGNFAKWQSIQNIPCNDIFSQQELKFNINKLSMKYLNILSKEEMKPKFGGKESLGHYIGRISMMASKKYEDGLLNMDNSYKIAA